MTDADEPAVRSVTTDGVTIEKSLAEDRFPVPAVEFQISSDNDREIEIRVTDVIPEEVPMDHIGFHPDFESDRWTAFSDHRVRFERTLDPGEDVETVYGIRDDGDFDPDEFLSDPSISTTDPERAAIGMDGPNVEDLLANGLPEDADGLVREFIEENEDAFAEEGDFAADADAPASPFEESDAVEEAFEDAMDPIGSEGESAGGEEDGVTTERSGGGNGAEESAERTFDADAMEPGPADDDLFRDPTEADVNASQEPARDGFDEDRAGQEGPSTTVPTTDSQDVAKALLADLKSGAVDQEVRDALREELVGGEGSQSMEIRLSHVQSRLEEISAYTDALEAFIDDHGTASVIETLDEEMDELSETVETLEADIRQERQERKDVAGRLQAVEGKVAGISAVDEDLTEVRSQLDTLESRLGSTDGKVEDTVEDLGAIRSEVRALSDDVAELSSRLDDFEAVAATVEDLESEIADLDDDIDALEAWRDTVSEAFGG